MIDLDSFSILAHEFKMPISIIRGSMEVLQKYHEGGKIEKINFSNYSQNVIKNCDILEKIATNVVDLHRNDNTLLMNLESINICDVLQKTIELIQQSFPKLNFHLIIPKEKENIVCDVEKIERVILNFISNSIKYAGESSSIRISIEFNNNNCIITYSDNGEGVSKDNLSFIFEPFAQVDHSFSRVSSGNGLGLAIVKKFVELHKGQIECDICNEGGLEFKVILPHTTDRTTSILCQDDFLLESNLARIIRIELSGLAG